MEATFNTRRLWNLESDAIQTRTQRRRQTPAGLELLRGRDSDLLFIRFLSQIHEPCLNKFDSLIP